MSNIEQFPRSGAALTPGCDMKRFQRWLLLGRPVACGAVDSDGPSGRRDVLSLRGLRSMAPTISRDALASGYGASVRSAEPGLAPCG